MNVVLVCIGQAPAKWEALVNPYNFSKNVQCHSKNTVKLFLISTII